MASNTLFRSFQGFRGFVTKGTFVTRYSSSQTSSLVVTNRVSPVVLWKTVMINRERSIYEPRLKDFRSVTLDIDPPKRSPSITEIGVFDTKLRIGEPPILPRAHEDVVNPDGNKTLELPAVENEIEKRAERMIVIRRRKMRRHKLRKLRKRMKFLWAKIRQRREMKREKDFHAELLAQIRRAETFDPVKHIERKFAILDNVRYPSRYRGELLPEAQIREFLRRDQERRQQKFNKPRLVL